MQNHIQFSQWEKATKIEAMVSLHLKAYAYSKWVALKFPVRQNFLEGL